MLVMKKGGRWYIVNKRTMCTVAGGFESQAEAYSEMRAIKDRQKAERETKKQAAAAAKTIPLTGLTKDGKPYRLLPNNGLEERSRHCFTLTIGGECIFTSGTVEMASRYI